MTTEEFSFKEENRKRNRLLARQMVKNPSLIFGLFVLLLLVIVVLFGQSWGSYDPYLVAQSARPYYDAELKEMVSPPFEPSAEYPLGSDQSGNDLLSLLLYGTRMTLIAGVYITLTRVALGTLLGVISGWREGRLIDRLIKSLSDLISSVPILLSSLIIIYALDIENGLWVFLVALSTVGWTETAQLIRSEVMRIRKREFIEAAESIGMTRLQVIVRHVLPNIMPYVLVLTALEMSAVLLLMAELGFLGTYIGGSSLYIPDVMSSQVFHLAEVPEWGALIAQSVGYIRSAPYILLAPALAFFIAIAGLNALGEGMRWLFDRFPMSMALLLRKRMLVIAAVFIALSAYVISFTGPKTSYLRVANSFNLNNAQFHVGALRAIQETSADPAADIDLYIEDAFKNLEIARGWKAHGFVSDYHFSYQVSMAEFKKEPELFFYGPANAEALTFTDDFNIVEDKALAGDDVFGQLVFVRHTFMDELAIIDDYDFTGMIPIVPARGITPEFAARVAERGAVGVLVVAPSANTKLAKQESLLIPDREASDDAAEEITPIPVFRISVEAADKLLAGEELSVEDFGGPGWHIKPLDTQVHMSLDIERKESVLTHSTIGFMGGYDSNLASEMVVLYTAYDSQNPSPQNFAGVATMIEIARTWHEKNLDPRRAVLFVAWDGASAGAPGASAFIGNPENFKNLTGLASAVPNPMMIWNLDLPNGVEDDTVWIHGASDEKMTELLLDASKLVGTPLKFDLLPPVDSPLLTSADVLSIDLPGAALVQPEGTGQMSFSDDLLGEGMQAYGESVSYVVLNILRKPKY